MRVPIPRAGLLEQLLTRALSPACNTGLPTLLHSRRPCPGRSHRRPIHPAPPGAEGPTGPAAPWSFIPVTNPIESTFATVRHRTKITRGPGSRAAGLAMAFKLIQAAQDRWRAVNGPHLV